MSFARMQAPGLLAGPCNTIEKGTLLPSPEPPTDPERRRSDRNMMHACAEPRGHPSLRFVPAKKRLDQRGYVIGLHSKYGRLGLDLELLPHSRAAPYSSDIDRLTDQLS